MKIHSRTLINAKFHINVTSIVPKKTPRKPRITDTSEKEYLVELLGDSRSNNPGVKTSNIDGDQGFERFGSHIRLNHVPKNHPFPLCVHIVCVFPP